LSKVTIYRFILYEITSDTSRQSRRWATREAIKRVGGEVLENTATEVDATVVVSDIAGMTERDFNPNKNTGFPRTVTS